MTLDIAKLRALYDAATPGPWDPVVDEPTFFCVADAEFIVAAHETLPAALDEIERLRSALIEALDGWDAIMLANCHLPKWHIVINRIDELRNLVPQ